MFPVGPSVALTEDAVGGGGGGRTAVLSLMEMVEPSILSNSA